jgi:hypothetical protein
MTYPRHRHIPFPLDPITGMTADRRRPTRWLSPCFTRPTVCRPAQVRSWLMAKQKGPTTEDRATAIRMALSGIAGGLELGEITARLAPLHPKNNTFPGEVLLELAADAIEESGASRGQPLEFEGIRKRHLPEDRAHTRAQHHKAEYALRAAAMVRAGSIPGCSTR